MVRPLWTWTLALLTVAALALTLPAGASANGPCTLSGTVVDLDLPSGDTTPVGTTTLTMTDTTNPSEGSVSTTFTGSNWSLNLPAYLDTYSLTATNPYYETWAGTHIGCDSIGGLALQAKLMNLIGYVTDTATERPLEDVMVTASESNGYTSGFLQYYTDVSGYYDLKLYDDQSWSIQYSAASYYGPSYTGASYSVAGPTTDPLEVDSPALTPTAAEIYGTVKDAGGNNLSGIKVEAGNYSATTNVYGQYTISGMQPGSYKVEFVPPAGDQHVYQFYNGQPSGTASQALASSVTTTNGNASLAGATLAVGATVTGTVQDDAGVALPGATVTLETPTGQPAGVPFGQLYQATTGSDGSYKLTGIPTGTYLEQASAPDNTHFPAVYPAVLQAGALSTAGAGQVTVTAPDITQSIDITERRAGLVWGTVSDAESGDAVAAGMIGFYDAGGALVASTTTNLDGAYSLQLPDGTWFARFDPAQPDTTGEAAVWYGGATAEAGSQPVTVAPGSSQQVSQILSASGTLTTTPPPATTGGSTTTKPTPTVKPAMRPKLSAVKLTGLAKRKVTLSFKLTAGAHELKSFTLKLPAELSFVRGGLKRNLALSKGVRFRYRLVKDVLTVVLAKPQSATVLDMKDGAISVAARLARHVKAKKIKHMTISLSVVDTAKLRTAISARVKPS